MKPGLKSIFITLACVGLLYVGCVGCEPVPDRTRDVKDYVSFNEYFLKQRTELREEPGAGRVVAVFEKGHSVIVYKKTDDGYWGFVRTTDYAERKYEGWVPMRNLYQ